MYCWTETPLLATGPPGGCPKEDTVLCIIISLVISGPQDVICFCVSAYAFKFLSTVLSLCTPCIENQSLMQFGSDSSDPTIEFPFLNNPRRSRQTNWSYSIAWNSLTLIYNTLEMSYIWLDRVYNDNNKFQTQAKEIKFQYAEVGLIELKCKPVLLDSLWNMTELTLPWSRIWWKSRLPVKSIWAMANIRSSHQIKLYLCLDPCL